MKIRLLVALLFTLGACQGEEAAEEVAKTKESAERSEAAAADTGDGDAAAKGDGADGAQGKPGEEPPQAEESLLAKLKDGRGLPQEAMAESEEATLIKGSVSIEGYEKGRVQIDLFRKAKGNQSPITNVRLDKPGSFEMWVPKGIGEVELKAILDLDLDGPSQQDPRGECAANPITIEDSPVDGVSIIFNINDVVPTPPTDPNASAGAVKGSEISDEEDGEIILSPSGGGSD